MLFTYTIAQECTLLNANATENRHLTILSSVSVWLDWAIYWTLGNFLKHLATINLSDSPTFLGNFLKVSKTIIFPVKSFLGNFYRHLAIFSGHTCPFGQNLNSKNGSKVNKRLCENKNAFSQSSSNLASNFLSLLRKELVP